MFTANPSKTSSTHVSRDIKLTYSSLPLSLPLNQILHKIISLSIKSISAVTPGIGFTTLVKRWEHLPLGAEPQVEITSGSICQIGISGKASLPPSQPSPRQVEPDRALGYRSHPIGFRFIRADLLVLRYFDPLAATASQLTRVDCTAQPHPQPGPVAPATVRGLLLGLRSDPGSEMRFQRRESDHPSSARPSPCLTPLGTWPKSTPPTSAPA